MYVSIRLLCERMTQVRLTKWQFHLLSTMFECLTFYSTESNYLLPFRIASFEPTDHSIACPSWPQPLLPVHKKQWIIWKTNKRPLKLRQSLMFILISTGHSWIDSVKGAIFSVLQIFGDWMFLSPYWVSDRIMPTVAVITLLCSHCTCRRDT